LILHLPLDLLQTWEGEPLKMENEDVGQLANLCLDLGLRTLAAFFTLVLVFGI
jgi:hypothetical protein